MSVLTFPRAKNANLDKVESLNGGYREAAPFFYPSRFAVPSLFFFSSSVIDVQILNISFSMRELYLYRLGENQQTFRPLDRSCARF